MQLVAECGPCEGQLTYAHQCVEALAPFAKHVVMKVQWYNADTLTTHHAARYDSTDRRSSTQTQYEMFSNALPYSAWREVRDHADSVNLDFFPTVFDLAAVDAAVTMGVGRLKIASGDITYRQLIQYAARYANHLVISTGASTADEIQRAVEWAGGRSSLTLLGCHLAYPTYMLDGSFGRISTLRRLFPPPISIGFSDHTPGIQSLPTIGLLNAAMVEKHFSLLGPGYGGDHEFAITSADLSTAVGILDTLEALRSGTSLDPTLAEQPALIGARRSVVAIVDIPRGTRITIDMVAILRPGTGVPPYEIDRVVATKGKGFTAFVDIAAGTPIQAQWVGLMGATLTVE